MRHHRQEPRVMWRDPDEPAARLDRSGVTPRPGYVPDARADYLAMPAPRRTNERHLSTSTRTRPIPGHQVLKPANGRDQHPPERSRSSIWPNMSLIALADAMFSDPAVCSRDLGTTMPRTSTYLSRASGPG